MWAIPRANLKYLHMQTLQHLDQTPPKKENVGCVSTFPR